ncbi:MAG: hypothetical protein QM500_11420, partial [Methylococcales bacterium]
ASKGEFGMAPKVEYVENRIPIDIISQNDQQILFTSILTKRKAWEYEEEYRCLASEPPIPELPSLDGKFMSFVPELLIGVIFGVRTSDEHIREIKEYGEKRKLKYWKAEITNEGDIIIKEED